MKFNEAAPVNGGSTRASKFDDPRLTVLNGERGLEHADLRQALRTALEPSEYARASYSLSVHKRAAAVLTDRALLMVKATGRTRAIRVPLPLDVTRMPTSRRKSARVRTPLGRKTLWGSVLDPDGSLLVAAAASPSSKTRALNPPSPEDTSAVRARGASHRDAKAAPAESASRLTRRQRAEARRKAGRKPRKPRRQRARAERVGFAPSSTIWDISYNCIKCGRALTNPNSQRHRVGTDCIKRWGSQARRIPNPQHREWVARKTKAEVARIAMQVKYDAEYKRAKENYDAALTQWQLVRSGGSIER